MKRAKGEYKRAYGVDADDLHLHVVLAERTRGGVTFSTVLDEDLVAGRLSDPRRLSSIQADVLAGTATLSLAMPTGSSFTRWLETPFGSKRKARRVGPALLDIQLPFPLETCAFRFPRIETTEGGDRVRALAVAARNEDIQQRLAQAEDLGLEPLVLDHEAQALWDQGVREATVPRPLSVVAYIGSTHSSLVLGQGGTFMAAFGLRAGAADMLSQMAEAKGDAGRGPLSSFVLRVRHVLRANIPADAASVAWSWVGSGAGNATLIHELEDRLRDDDRLVFSTHPEPGAFLARGLAERGLDGSGAAYNLRAGLFEHPLHTKRTVRHTARATAAWAAAGALLCAVNAAWLLTLNVHGRHLQDSITERARELTGMPSVPRGQEIHVVERALADRRERLIRSSRAGRREASQAMERIVTLAHDSGIDLAGVTMKPGLFSVRGTAPDRERCNAYAANVGIGDYTTDLAIEEEGAAGHVLFVLRGEALDE